MPDDYYQNGAQTKHYRSIVTLGNLLTIISIVGVGALTIGTSTARLAAAEQKIEKMERSDEKQTEAINTMSNRLTVMEVQQKQQAESLKEIKDYLKHVLDEVRKQNDERRVP